MPLSVCEGKPLSFPGSTGRLNLSPAGWARWANLLPEYGVTKGYVKVVNETPSTGFAAYGVVNDGATPGSATGTDDASYVHGVQ